MKATVIELFQDKYGEYHKPGETIELESSRLENLEKRNLIKVDSVAEKKPSKKKVKEA